MQIGYVWARDSAEIEDTETGLLGDPDIVSERHSYFDLSMMSTRAAS
jgi:hypothetical protein